MPYPNEHSARILSPDRFQKSHWSRMTLPNSDISVILGRLKGQTSTTIQAYRFPKNSYTPIQAQRWLRDHHIRVMKFEPARAETRMD